MENKLNNLLDNNSTRHTAIQIVTMSRCPEAEKLLLNSTKSEKSRFEKAADFIEKVSKESVFFRKHNPNKLPKFNRADVAIGRELGRGEFSVVSEITHIKAPPMEIAAPIIKAQGESKHQFPEDDEISLGDFNEVLFMSRECMRHGVARYAIKRIKPSIDRTKILDSAIDLALEAKFLAVLSHPNIIHMRGTGILPCHNSFFIVLDRLYFTLGEKIQSWKEIASKNIGFIARRTKNARKAKRQLWGERLLAAYDISRALKYLHGQRIIYRDLKPENIGFDIRGDAKIFDFGLAKELHEQDDVGDGLYNISGLTGSRRYMAPEVVLCMPYNETADVFSFGILLWQMCALEVPFEGYDAEKHSRKVVRQHERPKIESSWPVSVRDLIKEAWSPDINSRPVFGKICTILAHEVNNYGVCVQDSDPLDRSVSLMDTSNSSRRASIRRMSLTSEAFESDSL